MRASFSHPAHLRVSTEHIGKSRWRYPTDILRKRPMRANVAEPLPHGLRREVFDLQIGCGQIGCGGVLNRCEQERTDQNSQMAPRAGAKNPIKLLYYLIFS